jgi:hypothetical protein
MVLQFAARQVVYYSTGSNIGKLFINCNKTGIVRTNLTFRRVNATVVVKKHYILWVCVCSIRYPARTVHAPYCRLWPVWLYNIFSTLSHKRQDFQRKTRMNIICVYGFSLEILPETLLILRGIEWYGQTSTLVFMYSTRYSCLLLIKLEFSRDFFLNNQISNFTKIRPLAAELFHAGGRIWRS